MSAAELSAADAADERREERAPSAEREPMRAPSAELRERRADNIADEAAEHIFMTPPCASRRAMMPSTSAAAKDEPPRGRAIAEAAPH